ncbi:MAG: hypothetical protein KDA31_07105 [Phycisphaerales bacterium]|nr:hypothetical protein [Phycisphaerales bacterium]
MALLFVLGTLVLVAGALSLLTLAAAQSHRAESIATDERLAVDLLSAAEPIVHGWLVKESPSIVVHPDATEPVVPILDLTWQERADKHIENRSLRIAAWDIYGLVPSGTSSVSPLWLAVEPSWREFRYDEVSTLLDLMGQAEQVHPQINTKGISLGGQVGVIPDQDPRAAPTININTAPRALLETALRLAQRGDIASIVEARNEGRPATAPRRPSNSDRDPGMVELTGRSTLWAVRVDATVNCMTRSWWTVYESRRGQWEIIERHAIPE